MEIDNIAKQIFSEKPKLKFSICLNLDINSSINEQFEIMLDEDNDRKFLIIFMSIFSLSKSITVLLFFIKE